MKKKRILIAAIVVVVGIAIYLVSSLRNHRDDGSMLLSGNVEITETNKITTNKNAFFISCPF